MAVYYALYWDATINTRAIVLDQILFSPQWSPLLGQFRWMLEGRGVQWLLPLPDPALEWPVRGLLLSASLSAALLAWIWSGQERGVPALSTA